MARYWPFTLIWIWAITFFVWLATAPKTADERLWQVDAISLQMGSTEIVNPVNTTEGQTPSLAEAAKQPAAPENPVPTTAAAHTDELPLSSLSSWPFDGIKIKPLSDSLQEHGSHGPIPRTASDGTKPWQYYVRPFPTDNTQPRLAIIVRDNGLSDTSTDEAIHDLPGEVTLAFSPYGENLAKSMQDARDRGHETIVQMPLEVPSGSNLDVGPRAYSSSQNAAVN